MGDNLEKFVFIIFLVLALTGGLIISHDYTHSISVNGLESKPYLTININEITDKYEVENRNKLVLFDSYNFTECLQFAVDNTTQPIKQKILINTNNAISQRVLLDDNTLIDFNDNTIISNETNIIYADFKNNIELINGVLDGHNTYNIIGGLININNCTNIKIIDITTQNNNNSGIWLYGCNYGIVSNCLFKNNYETGICFRGSQNIKIENSIAYNSIVGIQILFNSKFIDIINCTTYNNIAKHISGDGSGIEFSNIDFSGMDSPSYCSVYNNKCYNNQNGVRIEANSNNIYVANNTLYNNIWAGIYIYSAQNNEITKNNCYNNDRGVMIEEISPSTPTPILYAFDFGTSASPVESGYLKVTEATLYSAGLGYGWTNTTNLNSVDRSAPDALKGDFIYNVPENTFNVDLANGDYQITITIGDQSHAHPGINVYAEDILKISELTTVAGSFHIDTFYVTITDGQLNLRISDSQSTHWVLNALTIEPSVAPTPTWDTSENNYFVSNILNNNESFDYLDASTGLNVME